MDPEFLALAIRCLRSANESARRKGHEKLPLDVIPLLVEKNPNWKCPYCKRDIPWERMSLDHVVPLAAWGPHTIDNLMFTCRRCNLYKKSLMPEVWQKLLDVLTKEGLVDTFFCEYQPRHFGG